MIGSPCWVSEDKTTLMLFYQTMWHKVRVFKFELCLNAENDTRLLPAPKVESAKLDRHTVRCAKKIPETFVSDISFSGLVVQKYNLTNHAVGVYIINSARNCISSKRNALYIIIAKAKYSLRLMICSLWRDMLVKADDIHAKA